MLKNKSMKMLNNMKTNNLIKKFKMITTGVNILESVKKYKKLKKSWLIKIKMGNG